MGYALQQLPDWPAALNWDEALAYTRLSDSELRRKTRQGKIVFLPVGPNGQKVALRSQLDAVLAEIWSTAKIDPAEDMRFAEDDD